MPWFSHEADSIARPQVEQMCQRLLDEAKKRLKIADFKRVLLLPPDLTRAHSGAGWITETLYKLLPSSCDTHVIPTLGESTPTTGAAASPVSASSPLPSLRRRPAAWPTGTSPSTSTPC
jgi:hypothetical protein